MSSVCVAASAVVGVEAAGRASVWLSVWVATGLWSLGRYWAVVTKEREKVLDFSKAKSG